MSASVTSGGWTSILRVAPEHPMPPPGSTALEVIVAEVATTVGRRALKIVGGRRLLRRLQSSGARFAAVVRGRDAQAVLQSHDEREFVTELTAGLIAAAPHVAGAIVILPFGGRELREKLLAAARAYELEIAVVGGRA